MGRENPRETSPAGKPSITTRLAAKQMGDVCSPYTGHGTEVGQTTYSPKGKSSTSGATSKGGLSVAPTPGGEYRQFSSTK